MDANQWSWGESLLRVVAGVARNDPMVTQYESVLRAELTEALCGMGLTVVRSRAEYTRSIQYYCISHRQGALEFVRYRTPNTSNTQEMNDRLAFFEEHLTTGPPDIQAGRSPVDSSLPSVFLNIELKVGSMFPFTKTHNATARTGRNAFRTDLPHLYQPVDRPRADAFIFVSDIGLYCMLRGLHVKRGKGVGHTWQKAGGGSFADILPPFEDVITESGQTVEHFVEYEGVRLRSLSRAVRPWGSRMQDVYIREGEDGDETKVSNNWLFAVLIGVAAADEEE